MKVFQHLIIFLKIDGAQVKSKATEVLTPEPKNFVKVQSGVYAMQGRRPAMEDR